MGEGRLQEWHGDLVGRDIGWCLGLKRWCICHTHLAPVA